MKVRTRIAPSPTGFPHIGTVYQALFDYAFAQKHGGQFVIRIEDTDRTRFVEGAENKIYEALDWLGLTENESPRNGGKYAPYRQSERLEIYQKYANELLEKGHAYVCTCTKERLDEVRKSQQAQKLPPKYDGHCRELGLKIDDCKRDSLPYVIRMKIPANSKIVTRDEIRGDVVFDSVAVDDQVLMKSDGFATYHLAVVVDDHLMEITHMLRGEDWLPSAPKQFLLYDMFGWDRPLFYHTVNIRNPDRSKMSKRHGHANVDWYRNEGYLPEALLNYLALLGWTHPTQKELFDLNEFVEQMDLKDLRAVEPIFDVKKLDWMNGEYLRKMTVDSCQSSVTEYLEKFKPEQYKIIESNTDFFTKSIPLIQERLKKLSEYFDLCEFFYTAPTTFEVDLKEHAELLKKTLQALEVVTDWTVQNIGDAMSKVCDESGAKRGSYFMMMRVAITGKKISPPLNESMEILGKEECMRRLKQIAA